MAIFQEGEAKVKQQKMEIEKSLRLRQKSDQTLIHPSKSDPSLSCSDAKKEKTEYFSYTSNTGALDMFRKHDIVLSMMKSQLDVAKLAPTSVAYNLLFTDNLQFPTKFSSLPVINQRQSH